MKKRKATVRKTSHDILKENAFEEENKENLNDESERENVDEEKEIDETDIENNGHLEDEEQDEEEE